MTQTSVASLRGGRHRAESLDDFTGIRIESRCETSWYASTAVTDLDGDGSMEILYPSYDSRLHAFSLEKTEHGSWPYSVNKPQEGFFRFAFEPAVADLNGVGSSELILISWTQKGS